MHRKRIAALLIVAAVLPHLAFTMLRRIFDYPDVLGQRADSVLAAFLAAQAEITLWFTVLAVAAALLVPIAIGVGELSSRPVMRVAVVVGIAAAVAQVIGLMRWPLLVPRYAAEAAGTYPGAAAAARDSFETSNLLLGNVIGETGGHLLTAAWTILVVAALRRSFAGRWFALAGVASAGLIAAGALSSLDMPVIDAAGFAGHTLWRLWLIAFAILLLRRPRTAGVHIRQQHHARHALRA